MHSDFSRGSYVKTCKILILKGFNTKVGVKNIRERGSDEQTKSEEDSEK